MMAIGLMITLVFTWLSISCEVEWHVRDSIAWRYLTYLTGTIAYFGVALMGASILKFLWETMP